MSGSSKVSIGSTAFLMLLAVQLCAAPTATVPPAQGAAALLAIQFPSRDLSYLLLDLHSGETVAERWAQANAPVPVGSLVKPFTALAYAESHNFRYPEHACTGLCWYPRGHGRVSLSRALAFSCNSYFTALAEAVSGWQVGAVAQRFGLRGPDAGAGPEALAGMHGAWRESPQAMAHAYAQLLVRRSQPGIREIVDGMTASAREGTAAGLLRITPHMPALAKTGTARCTHRHYAPGDGFALVAWPAESPRYLLLLCCHGKPGSETATLAGRMLRALEPQR